MTNIIEVEHADGTKECINLVHGPYLVKTGDKIYSGHTSEGIHFKDSVPGFIYVEEMEGETDVEKIKKSYEVANELARSGKPTQLVFEKDKTYDLREETE